MRDSDLVVPLGHKPTAMRTTDTDRFSDAASGAVSTLIGENGLRCGDVDSTKGRPTRPTTALPGRRTSTTATRTTTTATTSSGSASYADENRCADFSFKDVVAAHLDCRQNKRNTKACQEFEQDLGPNLWALYEELASGTYFPSRSICFVVKEPKVREVLAADYRDRIVHHLFWMKVGPRFLRSFIPDSCACIKGRGTMYAAERLERKIRSITQNWKKPGFYLKCDISNFFPSIRKDLVLRELAKKIPESFWLDLAKTILYHDPLSNVEVQASLADLALVPPHKSLFNQRPDVGLAIGNFNSQVFANVLLNVLDQHVKHDLHARYYGRYVDDFYILDSSPEYLSYAWADIDAFLPERLGLHLNPTKTIRQPIARGVDFVGQVIKPFHRRIRKKTASTALKKLAMMDEDKVYESANSYFGLHRQATHSHRDRAKVAKLVMSLGHTVNKAFTQTYRNSSCL